DVSSRPNNQSLQPFIKVLGRNLLGEVTVRLRRELLHGDPDHSTAAFVRAPACGFHRPRISARTDREAGISEQLTDAQRLRIFEVGFATFRSAKDGYNLFV